MSRIRSLLLCLSAALALASCKGRPPVPILGFHAVVPSPGHLDVSPEQFAAQLDALAAAGFHTVSLGQVLDHLERATPLPARPIVLTFDDGTDDAYRNVLPALRARGMTATFFVVSSWIGADAAHRRNEPLQPGEPSRPVLIWPELLALRAAGMEIGSHSRTHARLPLLEEKALEDELVGSRRELSAGLGAPVDLFAYPFNALRAKTEAAVLAAGYRAAVAGQEHGAQRTSALYRIGVYRDTKPDELVRYALAGSR